MPNWQRLKSNHHSKILTRTARRLISAWLEIHGRRNKEKIFSMVREARLAGVTVAGEGEATYGTFIPGRDMRLGTDQRVE